MRTTQQTLITKNREHQSRVTEQSNTIDSLKSQVSELSIFLKARDVAVAKESTARRDAETEVEKLHVKLEDAQRAVENSKPKGSENSQLEALRVCISRETPTHTGADLKLANCSLLRMQESFQKHGDSIMRTCILQTMCGRTNRVKVEKMPQLRTRICGYGFDICTFVTPSFFFLSFSCPHFIFFFLFIQQKTQRSGYCC